MDYSAANLSVWNFIIQLGVIAALILLSNLLKKRIGFFRKSLMPTAVLAGFLLLFLRSLNILRIDADLLSIMTYHGIAIGFIAMSLRVKKQGEKYPKNERLLRHLLLTDAEYTRRGR